MSKDESKKQDSFNGHQTSTSINISDRTQCFDMESDTVKVQMDQASENSLYASCSCWSRRFDRGFF